MAGKKKLSDEDKKQIISEYNAGEKRKNIALKYGVSETMVTYIVFPEKVSQMREKASKRDTEKAMNIERVHRYRERKKQS